MGDPFEEGKPGYEFLRMAHGAESIENLEQRALEEKAKKLLKWKISGKGKAPNPFENPETLSAEIEFLVLNGYATRRGQTPKSLEYNITEKGKKWATKD